MGKNGQAANAPRATRGAKNNGGSAGFATDGDAYVAPPGKKVLPPREPNPTREKRNPDPAKPDQPRSKRTTAQVAEETTRKALMVVKLQQLEAIRISMLAEIELNEEDDEAEQEAANVTNLADIVMMPTADFAALGAPPSPHPSDGDQMSIDTFHITLADLDKDYETLVEDKKKQDALDLHAKVMKGGPTKKKKGETRAAVDEAKAELKQSRKRKSDEGVDANEKAKKPKPLFPTGLSTNWRETVPTTVDLGKAKTASVVADSSGYLGGLTDLDAQAVAPAVVKGNRKVVEILTDSDESESDVDSIKSLIRPTPRPKVKKLPAIKVERENQSTPVRRLDLSKIAKKVKGAPSTLITGAGNPVPGGGSGGGGGGVAFVTGVPAFAQARWVQHFLPTVHAAIGALANPWDLPGGDVKFIQDVFSQVYYDSDYRVTLGCPVYQKTKDRINDKRSYFGRRAQAVIDIYMQGEEFLGKPKKVARYAKYALRDDGPSIWGIPAPAGIKKGEPGYTNPDDIFTSEHVVNVYAPYLKAAAGTVYNYGYARGALAMTLTGLERGWMKYLTGVKVDDGSQFSRDQVSVLVAEYYKSVDSLTPRRWKLILRKCAEKNQADVAMPLSASSMEPHRGALFTPSSPAAGSDDE
ncbi:hypothetical protein B0H15DRAFT_804274 [Mycena belliarum]|uniref:Uncharacterized protein n=1 Tax=Mycena belliarum TaxID=1033014 RepID=A0AAD6XHV4_9AGAR|nr:hypothetical protein B0H15DRAFT_804274 [Mycena belliae]